MSRSTDKKTSRPAKKTAKKAAARKATPKKATPKKASARQAASASRPAKKAAKKATKKAAKRGAKTKEPRPSIVEQLPPPPVEGDDTETLVFLKAVDKFKRQTGRSFPSYTELLEIVKSLGYRKVATPD